MLKCASQATAPAKSHNIPIQNCKMEANDIPPTFPLSLENSQLTREVRVSDKGKVQTPQFLVSGMGALELPGRKY